MNKQQQATNLLDINLSLYAGKNQPQTVAYQAENLMVHIELSATDTRENTTLRELLNTESVRHIIVDSEHALDNFNGVNYWGVDWEALAN